MYATFRSSVLTGLYRTKGCGDHDELEVSIDPAVGVRLLKNIRLWKHVELVGAYPSLQIRVSHPEITGISDDTLYLSQSRKVSNPDHADLCIHLPVEQTVEPSVLDNRWGVTECFVVNSGFPLVCTGIVGKQWDDTVTADHIVWYAQLLREVIMDQSSILLTPSGAQTHTIMDARITLIKQAQTALWNDPTYFHHTIVTTGSVVTFADTLYTIDSAFPLIAISHHYEN